MGGVAVAERMHVGALVDAALCDRADEGALQAGARDGRRGRNGGGLEAGAGKRRGKEPQRMTVRAPVGAEQREGRIGERT